MLSEYTSVSGSEINDMLCFIMDMQPAGIYADGPVIPHWNLFRGGMIARRNLFTGVWCHRQQFISRGLIPHWHVLDQVLKACRSLPRDALSKLLECKNYISSVPQAQNLFLFLGASDPGEEFCNTNFSANSKHNAKNNLGYESCKKPEAKNLGLLAL